MLPMLIDPSFVTTTQINPNSNLLLGNSYYGHQNQLNQPKKTGDFIHPKNVRNFEFVLNDIILTVNSLSLLRKS
jgi:hypothetical protein